MGEAAPLPRHYLAPFDVGRAGGMPQSPGVAGLQITLAVLPDVLRKQIVVDVSYS